MGIPKRKKRRIDGVGSGRKSLQPRPACAITVGFSLEQVGLGEVRVDSENTVIQILQPKGRIDFTTANIQPDAGAWQS